MDRVAFRHGHEGGPQYLVGDAITVANDADDETVLGWILRWDR